MNEPGTTELIFVLAVMGVLFLFGVAACVVFYRVWRREQRDKLDGRLPGAVPARPEQTPPPAEP